MLGELLREDRGEGAKVLEELENAELDLDTREC